MDQRETRYRDDNVTYAGIDGENLVISPVDPINYHQAITDPDGAPATSS